MHDKSKDFARVRHILEAIQGIEKYIKGKDFPVFINDSMFHFACINQLKIIGEASNRT